MTKCHASLQVYSGSHFENSVLGLLKRPSVFIGTELWQDGRSAAPPITCISIKSLTWPWIYRNKTMRFCLDFQRSSWHGLPSLLSAFCLLSFSQSAWPLNLAFICFSSMLILCTQNTSLGLFGLQFWDIVSKMLSFAVTLKMKALKSQVRPADPGPLLQPIRSEI